MLIPTPLTVGQFDDPDDALAEAEEAHARAIERAWYAELAIEERRKAQAERGAMNERFEAAHARLLLQQEEFRLLAAEREAKWERDRARRLASEQADALRQERHREIRDMEMRRQHEIDRAKLEREWARLALVDRDRRVIDESVNSTSTEEERRQRRRRRRADRETIRPSDGTEGMLDGVGNRVCFRVTADTITFAPAAVRSPGSPSRSRGKSRGRSGSRRIRDGSRRRSLRDADKQSAADMPTDAGGAPAASRTDGRLPDIPRSVVGEPAREASMRDPSARRGSAGDGARRASHRRRYSDSEASDADSRSPSRSRGRGRR